MYKFSEYINFQISLKKKHDLVSYVSIKETQILVQNSTKQTPVPNALTDWFYQTFKEEVTLIHKQYTKSSRKYFLSQSMWLALHWCPDWTVIATSLIAVLFYQTNIPSKFMHWNWLCLLNGFLSRTTLPPFSLLFHDYP